MGVKEDKFNDYDGFVEKFKPKKTTDDCYTPQPVYDVVRDWVDQNVVSLKGRRIVRPFYPGGDFTQVDYKPGDIVLDNPPFSILAKICDWYHARGIDFFLFAPCLTLFSKKTEWVSFVYGGQIIYENGASIPTGFITNMIEDDRVIVDGDFSVELERTSRRGAPKAVRKPKYFPVEVLSSGRLAKFAKSGMKYKIKKKDSVFVEREGSWIVELSCMAGVYSCRNVQQQNVQQQNAQQRKGQQRNAQC